MQPNDGQRELSETLGVDDMANSTVQARIDPELKQEAEAVFAAMGMTTAQAIRIFLQQTVNRGGLPFQPTAKMPNAETIRAMAELEAQGGQVFETAEALFADWER
jgi:DNA-damage-inducible protein J